MELNELRVFVKIVQHGSLTRAADALTLDKAQVSRSLAQLEAKLEARLLQRSTRSLRLTEIGREIFERALGILQSVDEAEMVARQRRQQPAGPLRLTCGPEFGMLRVGAWINAFLAQHPLVSVEAEYTSRLVDLIHEGFDLAVRVGPLRDSRLSARKLGQLAYGFFASRSYIASRGMPAHPRDLTGGHDLLTFTLGGARKSWLFSSADETIEVPHEGRMTVNNAFALRDAAEAGLGIARLPLIVVCDRDERLGLTRVFPDWTTPGADVHAVFPSNRYLSPNVRGFIDLAVEAMRADDAAVRNWVQKSS